MVILSNFTLWESKKVVASFNLHYGRGMSRSSALLGEELLAQNKLLIHKIKRPIVTTSIGLYRVLVFLLRLLDFDLHVVVKCVIL